jgi:hypothetical protein
MNKKIFSKDGFTFIKDTTHPQAKYPVLSTCPVCHHDLTVVKLACEHCNTTVDGAFNLSKFNYLDTEKLYFIELFVKNRGNIKAIEKEMNLSYPTIKKMLDDVIVGLGYTPDIPEEQTAPPVQPQTPVKPKVTRTEILDQLEKGAISVAEAIASIAKL